MSTQRSTTSNLRRGFRPISAVVSVACLAWAAPQLAHAADDAFEREQLAALVRQLDQLDRVTDQVSRLASQERTRYHFDYARLHEDVQRIRIGVQDYLTPQRAQPRDPAVLIGDYRREDNAAPPASAREAHKP